MTIDNLWIRACASAALAIMLPALAGCDSASGLPSQAKAEAKPETKSTHYASGAIVPEGQSFTCTPTKVWDGDGPVWCAEGPRIRLSGIATREMNGRCRSNQPCPDGSAEDARDYLVHLLGSPAGEDSRGHILVAGARALSCDSLGSGKGKRTAAWCRSPRIGDVSCRMVASGLALRWDVYWKDHICPPARIS